MNTHISSNRTSTLAKTMHKDRNFDSIADHFAKKIYGGLKGEIRLAVLRQDIEHIEQQLTDTLNRPLKVLDIGAGLAQLSIQLASRGHSVVINDASAKLLQQAKNEADRLGVSSHIRWHVCPYQALANQLTSDSFDLILCHALLEWLGSPKQVFPFFKQWLAPHGKLSLCFYNPASFVYRNLIMGNFYLLDSQQDHSNNLLANKPLKNKPSNDRSLTPNNPVEFAQVNAWLEALSFEIESVSGLRVFHDYAPLKRGGHEHPKEVIRMELRYASQEPFKWLGRYLHVIASPTMSNDGGIANGEINGGTGNDIIDKGMTHRPQIRR